VRAAVAADGRQAADPRRRGAGGAVHDPQAAAALRRLRPGAEAGTAVSDPDPLEAINPLLRPIVEAVTIAMAGAFDVIWTRPDAAELAEAFLDGRLVFQVHRSGILILEQEATER
jgi:hypothetical protein